MSTLKKKLQQARPCLKTVTPLAYWITIVFAYFNFFLGISLFFAVDQSKVSAPLIIVNDIFTYKFWGTVFILVGLLKLYALRANNWELSRHSLLIGVSIKAAWALALVIRALSSPGTWLMAIMWIALAMIQITTYIFFMPPSTAAYKQRRGDR